MSCFPILLFCHLDIRFLVGKVDKSSNPATNCKTTKIYPPKMTPRVVLKIMVVIKKEIRIIWKNSFSLILVFFFSYPVILGKIVPTNKQITITTQILISEVYQKLLELEKIKRSVMAIGADNKNTMCIILVIKMSLGSYLSSIRSPFLCLFPI